MTDHFKVLFQVDRVQIHQVDSDQKTTLLASGLLRVSRRAIAISSENISPENSSPSISTPSNSVTPGHTESSTGVPSSLQYQKPISSDGIPPSVQYQQLSTGASDASPPTIQDQTPNNRVSPFSLQSQQRTPIESPPPLSPSSKDASPSSSNDTIDEDSKDQRQRSLTFLQIDEFNIPLFAFLPVLRCGTGKYLIPIPGSSYYVLHLHPDTPLIYFQKFEEMICEAVPGLELTSEESVFETKMTAAETTTLELQNELMQSAEEQGQPMSRQQSWADSLTILIEAGSVQIASTISQTARLAGRGITLGGGYLQRNLQPAQEPTKVSPTVQKTLAGGRVAAQTVQTWTAYIAHGMSEAASATGRKAISALGLSKKPSAESSYAKIARTGVQALDQISLALYESGIYLLDELSTTTTQVVKHKYGEEAAIAAENGLGIAADVTKTVMSANKLGYTAVLKSAAKSGAKEALVSKPLGQPVRIEEIEDDDVDNNKKEGSKTQEQISS